MRSSDVPPEDSDEPAYQSPPAYFTERFVPALTQLLDTAAAAGDIRSDVIPYDLLRAMSGIVEPDDDAYTQRMITLLVDGLRYGTRTASA